MTGMGFCNICKTDVATVELVSHLCIYHPDLYQPFETWPDGELVVIDGSLSPKDFVDGEAL